MSITVSVIQFVVEKQRKSCSVSSADKFPQGVVLFFDERILILRCLELPNKKNPHSLQSIKGKIFPLYGAFHGRYEVSENS